MYYQLFSDFDKMISARQSITRVKLEPVDLRLFDANIPDPRNTGSPSAYMIVGHDSSQQYQMALHPVPDDEMNIDIRYYKKIATDLSSDTDVPLIPDQYRPIIVFDVISRYGYLFLDDTRISQAKSLRDQFMNDMKSSANPAPDLVVKKLPWDVAQRFTPITNRLPFNFPIEE